MYVYIFCKYNVCMCTYIYIYRQHFLSQTFFIKCLYIYIQKYFLLYSQGSYSWTQVAIVINIYIYIYIYIHTNTQMIYIRVTSI